MARSISFRFRDALHLFRSIRFNIFLGLLIAVASAIGTLIPQLPETPEKAQQFMALHPALSRVYDLLGFFDLYGSWWFMGMLGLMAFDIVVCKLWKTPPDPGVMALPPEFNRDEEAERHLADKEKALRLKPFQAGFQSTLGSETALTNAQDFLKRSGYHLHPIHSAPSGRTAFVSTRHRPQRWGSYFAHIGLVIILVGSLIKGVWGFVEMVPVLEGGSRAMFNKPEWQVYVDDFTVDYYEGTTVPKFFSSSMRVKENDIVLGDKTIKVNDPLDIDGIRFYQASWGAGGLFRTVTLDLGDQQVRLAQGEAVEIPDSGISVKADVMLPDFTITPEGQAETASFELRNPAVRIIFSMGKKKTYPLWLMLDRPGLCFVESPAGFLDRADPPPFRLTDIDPILFSGIQVAYDPGYRVVVLGSLMWLFGTIALFYLHRRRLWVLLEPVTKGSRVYVGGWSSRGTREFEDEFESLMKGLRVRLKSDGDLSIPLDPLPGSI